MQVWGRPGHTGPELVSLRSCIMAWWQPSISLLQQPHPWRLLPQTYPITWAPGGVLWLPSGSRPSNSGLANQQTPCCPVADWPPPPPGRSELLSLSCLGIPCHHRLHVSTGFAILPTAWLLSPHLIQTSNYKGPARKPCSGVIHLMQASCFFPNFKYKSFKEYMYSQSCFYIKFGD